MDQLNEMCVEVLRMTNDGDDLAPKHLFLVELVVNGLANDPGKAELEKVWQELKKGQYNKWYFDIFGLTLDAAGFVCWFGENVEHYSYLKGNYSDDARHAATKLVTKIQSQEQQVISKLHAEGVTLHSSWQVIESVLSKTVSPTHCLEIARRLFDRFNDSEDWANYYKNCEKGVLEYV